MSANGGTLTAAYDDATATTTVTSAPATGPTRTTVTALNADGTVKTRRDNGGTTTTFQYDPLGRLTRAPMPNLGGSQPAFYWRLDGLLDARTLGAATLSYTYDSAKRPTALSVTGSPTGTLSRTLDRVGNVTSEAQTLSGVTTVAGNGSIQYFGYDALSRVTSATWSQTPAGAQNESFTYDADSNRLTATKGGTTTTTVYTVFDAPLTVQTGSGAVQTTTYDVLGRMRRSYTGSTVYTNYTYDAAGKLVSITPSSGAANTVTFSLDALGRHSQRVVGSATTEQYTCLGVTDTATRVATVGGSTTDSPIDALGNRLAATVGGTVNWLLPDLHGNTAAAFAGSAYSAAYRYDPYGDNVAASTGAAAIPWRFQGRLLESASGGDELYDFDARSYDPALGTFTSLDSVAGSIQNPLTLNRYLYANANPATLIDPDGHRANTNIDRGGGNSSTYNDVSVIATLDEQRAQEQAKTAEQNRGREVRTRSLAADAAPAPILVVRIGNDLAAVPIPVDSHVLVPSGFELRLPTFAEWNAMSNDEILAWSSAYGEEAYLVLEQSHEFASEHDQVFQMAATYLAITGGIETSLSRRDYYSERHVSLAYRTAQLAGDTGAIAYFAILMSGFVGLTDKDGNTLEMREYGKNKGHHPLAQSALRKAKGYSPRKALSISKDELAKYDVTHVDITREQRRLYGEFAASGKPLTFADMRRIESQAMMLRGKGLPPSLAEQAVDLEIANMKALGITPQRIPWGKD